MNLWNETKSIPISRQMVWQAYKKVKANKGSAGVDSISMEEFDANRSKHLYINSLDIEIKKLKLNSEKNREIDIIFNNQKVGDYKANLIVEDKILIQVFNTEKKVYNHEQKVYNQLKLSKYKVALILNFGINPEFKRKQDEMIK